MLARKLDTLHNARPLLNSRASMAMLSPPITKYTSRLPLSLSSMSSSRDPCANINAVCHRSLVSKRFNTCIFSSPPFVSLVYPVRENHPLKAGDHHLIKLMIVLLLNRIVRNRDSLTGFTPLEIPAAVILCHFHTAATKLTCHL